MTKEELISTIYSVDYRGPYQRIGQWIMNCFRDYMYENECYDDNTWIPIVNGVVHDIWQADNWEYPMVSRYIDLMITFIDNREK